MKWWKLAPALLLAGMTWSGLAAADDDKDGRRGKGDFDGPGGMSAPSGRMGAGMRGGRGDRMAKLDLTDRQKEQIRTIREQQRRRMIPLHARLQEAKLDLRQLLRADRPSQERIDAAIDQMAELRADAHKARVASMLQIRGLLTDAQRKKLEEQRGSMRGWGARSRRGGGMRHEGGGGMHHENSGADKGRAGSGRAA